MVLIQEGLLFAFIGHSKNITLCTSNVNLVLIMGDVAPGFEPRIMYKIVPQNCSKSFTKV